MDERLGLHAEAMGLLDAVVQHVTDEDLDRPTPCAGWTVADLLAHEVGQHLGFAAAVATRRPGVGVRAGALQPGDVARLGRGGPERVRRRHPDAPVTERELAEVPLPLRAVVDAQLLDVLAHTWDLAKGLGPGDHFTPPDHFAAQFLRMAQDIKDRAYGEGRAFRERLKPEGSDWEQGLRLLGRDPGWAPGVS